MAADVKDSLIVKELRVESTRPATGAYTTTNVNTSRTLNANVNDTLITSDVLCTLIEDLKLKGIIE